MIIHTYSYISIFFPVRIRIQNEFVISAGKLKCSEDSKSRLLRLCKEGVLGMAMREAMERP
jgi:hypothetical protein